MLTIKEINSYCETLVLKDQWDRIVDEAGLDISLSFDFSAFLWEAHLNKKDIVVLLAKEGDEIVGIFPLVISRARVLGVIPITSIGPLSNIFCFHNNFICKINITECLKAVLAYLDEHYPGWGVFEMLNASDDSNILKLSFNSWKKRCLSYRSGEAPYVRIVKTWDEYIQTRSKKFRKLIRHKGIELEESGRFFFMDCLGGDESDFILRNIHEVEKESWKEKADISIAADEKQEKLYESFLGNPDFNNNVFASFLFCGQECAAFRIGVISKNKFYSLKSAYKKKFSDYSPGFLLMRHDLGYFFNKNFSEFDLLSGNPSWKQGWANGVRKTFNLQVYNNLFYSRTVYHLKRLTLLLKR